MTVPTASLVTLRLLELVLHLTFHSSFGYYRGVVYTGQVSSVHDIERAIKNFDVSNNLLKLKAVPSPQLLLERFGFP